MGDYSQMSIKDLEELKEDLLNRKSNLNNTIEEVVNNIKYKKTLTNNDTLRINPYYKNKVSCIKVDISDRGEYIVTKITPSGKYLGISQYISNTTDFLKYYEMCSKSEWECALSKLNMWLKDSNLKLKSYD